MSDSKPFWLMCRDCMIGEKSLSSRLHGHLTIDNGTLLCIDHLRSKIAEESAANVRALENDQFDAQDEPREEEDPYSRFRHEPKPPYSRPEVEDMAKEFERSWQKATTNYKSQDFYLPKDTARKMTLFYPHLAKYFHEAKKSTGEMTADELGNLSVQAMVRNSHEKQAIQQFNEMTQLERGWNGSPECLPPAASCLHMIQCLLPFVSQVKTDMVPLLLSPLSDGSVRMEWCWQKKLFTFIARPGNLMYMTCDDFTVDETPVDYLGPWEESQAIRFMVSGEAPPKNVENES